MRVLEPTPRTFRRWVNDWGGVLGEAAERFLRNTPEAYAVLVWHDHNGLNVEQFDSGPELDARERGPMPDRYAIVWRRTEA